MRSTCLVAALAGLAYAAPKPSPQFINFEEFDAAEAPAATGPAPEAVSEPVTYSEPAAKAEAAAEVTQELSTPGKRSLAARGVNDPCSPQPDGYGPKPPVDTDADFLAFSNFSVGSSSPYLIELSTDCFSRILPRLPKLLKATRSPSRTRRPRYL